jgi:hypothetical protein
LSKKKIASFSLSKLFFVLALVGCVVALVSERNRLLSKQSLLLSKLSDAENYALRWLYIKYDISIARELMLLQLGENQTSEGIRELVAAKVLSAIEGVFDLRQETRKQGDFQESLELYRTAIEIVGLRSPAEVRAFIAAQGKEGIDEVTFKYMFPHIADQESTEYHEFEGFLETVFESNPSKSAYL